MTTYLKLPHELENLDNFFLSPHTRRQANDKFTFTINSPLAKNLIQHFKVVKIMKKYNNIFYFISPWIRQSLQ